METFSLAFGLICLISFLISALGFIYFVYFFSIGYAFSIAGMSVLTMVLFSGARRLELRQNKNYGDRPEYQEYVAKVPIILPLVPLYSVVKYKWLMA